MTGDAGHAIRANNPEARNWKVRRIKTDKRNVGSMQCGDDGEIAALVGKHLLGEQCAHGVRDGIVNVQKIERVELGDLSHSGRKCKIVGWVFEKWVVCDGYFVKMNVGLSAGETEGLRVGDEVNFMATCREFDSEFRGDDSTAAISRIAGDADLHRDLRSL